MSCSQADRSYTAAAGVSVT